MASPQIVETYKHMIFHLADDTPHEKHIITAIEPHFAAMSAFSDRVKNVKEGDELTIVRYAPAPGQPTVYNVRVRENFDVIILHSPNVPLTTEDCLRLHTSWCGLRYNMLGFSAKDEHGNAVLSCIEGTISGSMLDSHRCIPGSARASKGDIGGPCFVADDAFAFVGMNVMSAEQRFAESGTFDKKLGALIDLLAGRSYIIPSEGVNSGIASTKSKDGLWPPEERLVFLDDY